MLNLNWDLLNYITSLWLSGTASLTLGTFVLFKDKTSKLNQTFFLYSLCIAIWGFSQGVAEFSLLLAQIAVRTEHVVIVLIPAFFLHFVTILTNRPHKLLLRCAYLAGGFLSILAAFTTTIVKSFVPMQVSPNWQMVYATVPGELYIIYFTFFVSISIYSIYLLYKEYRLSRGAKRNQLKYMLVGSIIGYAGGGLNFCYVFKIPIYPLLPFATYAVPIYVCLAAYAIVKHRLMDIKIAMSRTGLLVFIYGLIIVTSFQSTVIFKPYLANTFGRYWIYFPIVMYTILLSYAPFLYIYIQKKMEETILKKQRRYQRALKQLSEGMTRIKDLYKLLDLTTIQIVRAVRLNHASVFLYDKSTDRYILRASHGRRKKEIGRELKPDYLLVRYFSRRKTPLIYDEIDKSSNIEKTSLPDTTKMNPNMSDLKSIMQELDASLCIPGFIEDKLTDILVLGEKLSGEIYTQEDIDTFATLTNQVTLAIDNALAYEELMSTRDQLIEGERLAAIGRFASEVAHEIKNPLQAIRTFTDLINEKHNDKRFREKFSKIASQEIDRMDNFVRRLIKVAHPLPPKLGPCDIKEVLNSCLELMENDFKDKDITIKREYPKTPLRIEADKDQLKQAFINLLVNAIDAMKDSSKRVLTLSISSSKSYAVIKITDTGCGISKESLPHLFNPLFTTKEKGSGLGLSIVDTIIKNHKGKIEVEGKPEKGTTFTINLPIHTKIKG